MKKIMSVAVSIMLGISMTACSSGVDAKEVIATVNGKDITAGKYETTLALYKQSTESMYGEAIWETEIEEGIKYGDQFKDMILQQMIDMEVVYEQAEKEKLLPSKEEVDEQFKTLKESIDSNEESKKQFKEIGATDEYLKEQQKQDLAIQNYKVNFDKTTKVSEDEMKKYYEDNKKSYYRNEVKASHILISTVDEDNKPLSDEKKKEAKKKAEDILKKAKSGEEFATLAKENSDDPGSGSNGGDLGYFGKGRMVPEFEQAAFALEVGGISDLVESEFGYHIIKLTDKVDEQKPYEDVKDDIKKILLNEKFMKKIEELSKASKIEKNEDILKKIRL